MIIRHAVSRQGWRSFARHPARQCRRCLETQTHLPDNTTTTSISLEQASQSQNAEQSSTLERLFAVKHDAVAPPDRISEEYHAFERHKQATQHLGSTISPHYQPHTLVLNPPSPADLTLELLLASQSHLGHATSLWNPANARYIYGIRQGIHIISLDSTLSHLRRACTIVSAVAERAGLILFVGTREGQSRAVVKAAELSKGCHLFTRWLPGTITNSSQILGSCKTQTVDEHDNPVPGFERQLNELQPLKPDLVVCLNPLENYVLLHECGMANIPTIGIVDTDTDPTWVTYPIPANDDSLRCVQVIAGVLGRAGQHGQEKRLAAAKQGRITYTKSHGLKAPEDPDTAAEEEEEDEEEEEKKKEDMVSKSESESTAQAATSDSAISGDKKHATESEGSKAQVQESKVPRSGSVDLHARDSQLDAMIALKRQQMGEPLSKSDEAMIAKLKAKGIRHLDQLAY